MNRRLPKLICLLLLISILPPLVRYCSQPGATAEEPQESPAQGVTTASRGPFIIHYSCNDSHSKSWVQQNVAGEVGVTYFEHLAGSHAEGTLYYKTIGPFGTETVETIHSGIHLEKSVLLYDLESRPHIFVACSDDTDQVINHYFRDTGGAWQTEAIVHFFNEGGKFIYELSADIGPDHSFHLLILKTRSNIDSDDFLEAWRGANLYHLTNVSGTWETDLIRHYNMAWTEDMYVKSSCRQDIEIDDGGFVHVAFSEQLDYGDYPSRLWYATNRTGVWEFEVALSYAAGTPDDAGWYPSLCLDINDTPHIACAYISRVPTLSARHSKLHLLRRTDGGLWHDTIIADQDDGYYGGDGRRYTGALSHLVFDSNNTPHIVFSDVASTHWSYQSWNVGNIRYGVRRAGNWEFETIFRQRLPTGFFNATEMYGMCMTINEAINTIRVIGVELIVTGRNQYTSRLVDFVLRWDGISTVVQHFTGSRQPHAVSLRWSIPALDPRSELQIWRQTDDEQRIRIFSLPGGDQELCAYTDEEAPTGAVVYWLALVDPDGSRSWIGSTQISADDQLLQNSMLAAFPNPFNPTTELKYELQNSCLVDLSIFDLRGSRICRLVNGVVLAGRHRSRWHGLDESGRAVPSGSYIARLETDQSISQQVLMLLK